MVQGKDFSSQPLNFVYTKPMEEWIFVAPSTAHHPELWPNIGRKWTQGGGADPGVQSKRNPCAPPQLAKRWSVFRGIGHASRLVSLDQEFEVIWAIIINILLSEEACFIIDAV